MFSTTSFSSRPLAVHVVDFVGHRVAQLALEADRCLEGAWQVDEIERSHELLQIANEAPGPVAVVVTEPLQCLIVGR